MCVVLVSNNQAYISVLLLVFFCIFVVQSSSERHKGSWLVMERAEFFLTDWKTPFCQRLPRFLACSRRRPAAMQGYRTTGFSVERQSDSKFRPLVWNGCVLLCSAWLSCRGGKDSWVFYQPPLFILLRLRTWIFRGFFSECFLDLTLSKEHGVWQYITHSLSLSVLLSLSASLHWSI